MIKIDEVEGLMQSLQSQVDGLSQTISKQIATPSKSKLFIDPTPLPQGNGSSLNSDKVDGINASYKPMPNTLIPLGPNGQFPKSVIPASGGGGSGFLLGNGAPTDKNILIADGTLWQSRAMSGDATITADTGTLTLATSGVTAATYGDTSHYPIITVDAKGRITSASNQAGGVAAGNSGDIQFNNSGSFGGVDDLFWDNTHKRLGIGTNAPSYRIDVEVATAATIAVFNTTAGSASTTNSALLYASADADQFSNGYIKPLHSGTNYQATTFFGTSYTPIIIDSGANGQTGTPDTYIAFQTAVASAASTEKVRIDNTGKMGIATTSPTSLFSVGSSSQFQVNSSGNIVKLNNVTQSWPASQGAASSILQNDGSGNLSWTSSGSFNIKSNTISHYCGYFRTESGLTLPTTFLTTKNDAAITVKRITVDPVVVSIGAGTGTVFRFTDGTTNCDITLGPGVSNTTATFTQNYASNSTLQMKVVSDDNATPPTDINVVVEYIIQ